MAPAAAPSVNQGTRGRPLVGESLHGALRLAEPGERYEREVDRVADAVGPTISQDARGRGPLSIQRVGAGDGDAMTAPPSVQNVLSSPGQSLDSATRTAFEARLGHDFGQVRVHTDAQAAESARAMNARAYTVGHHAVFGAGEYQPRSRDGARLLAHELTHVVQQGAGTAGRDLAVQRDDRDKRKRREPEKAPEKAPDKPPEKAPDKDPWSRKLTDGPFLLDGDRPSYQVLFDHVLPPVPKGATQVWQVVEMTHTVLTEKCEEKTEKSAIIDVVNIDKRTAVNDDWNWIRRDKLCFAMEASRATVGFDDQKSNFAAQTGEVTNELAERILKRLAGPKGTYSGTYTFAKRGNCKDCADQVKALQKKHGAPDGEALVIDGVGRWPRP